MRQYGVADFEDHAGHAGRLIDSYYKDVLSLSETVQEDGGGQVGNGRFQYHAQATIVVPGTVDSTVFRFKGQGNVTPAEACDLAGRLMASMLAVTSANQGDQRCLPQMSGTNAFLAVDNPDGTKLSEINIIGDGSFETINALYEEFVQWRELNPCNARETRAPMTPKSVAPSFVEATDAPAPPPCGETVFL